jgi:hypothetical protein
VGHLPFLPDHNELYLYFTPSNVTADFIADCLSDFWQMVGWRFPQVTTLLLNQDNGPENNSRRTKFMERVAKLADLLNYASRGQKSQMALGGKTTFYVLILNAPTPKCCGFGNMPDLTLFSWLKQPDLP